MHAPLDLAAASPWLAAQRAAVAVAGWRGAMVTAGTLLLIGPILMLPLAVVVVYLGLNIGWFVPLMLIWLGGMPLIVIISMIAGKRARNRAARCIKEAREKPFEPPVTPAQCGDPAGDFTLVEAEPDRLVLRSLIGLLLDDHSTRAFLLLIMLVVPLLVSMVSIAFALAPTWTIVPASLTIAAMWAGLTPATFRRITIKRDFSTTVTVVRRSLVRRRRVEHVLSESAEIAILSAGLLKTNDQKNEDEENDYVLAIVDGEEVIELAHLRPLLEDEGYERIAHWNLKRLAAAVAACTGLPLLCCDLWDAGVGCDRSDA